MKRRKFIALLGSAAVVRPLSARAQRPLERILYFTYSAGYRHEVIPLSKAFLIQLGGNSGLFEVTATEDMSEFSTENLERYGAVMFYTTGELPMSGAQKTALLNFVRSGRGFLGVHSATDTFYSWPDYLDLIGGYFNGHPWHQAVTIEVVDPGNPLVAFLGKSLQIEDEIYQISDFDYRGSHVLLRLDQSSVDLSKTGVHQRFYGWPLAWTRFYGRGGYSIRRLATKPRFGRTLATSECSQTLSSGLCEARSRRRKTSPATLLARADEVIEKTRPCPSLALFGHAAISELSLHSEVKRKLDFEPARGSFWREAAICRLLDLWLPPKVKKLMEISMKRLVGYKRAGPTAETKACLPLSMSARKLVGFPKKEIYVAFEYAL